ncbi:AzlD domain-containing protein [Leeia sp. TBRC 13508]|uniref:AzlD domain-containing protein n=1 Tax=Leeia speluncae TaxID=2884804 RepID=A0ABS8D7G8_9NEIS|nr:AzlD domain-containing protein [Leeia speluncae]MCB6184154.1 AzlD domain-containing protein [Leeia speluncae]
MRDTLMIIGMMLVTFLPRAFFFVLGEKLHFSENLKTALTFVPVTVLTAITVPMLVLQGDKLALSTSNPWWIAGLVTILVAKLQKNALVTIVVGLCFFFAYKYLVLAA